MAAHWLTITVSWLYLTAACGCGNPADILPRATASEVASPALRDSTPLPPLTAAELADRIDAELAKIQRIRVKYRLSQGLVADRKAPAVPLDLYSPEYRRHLDDALSGSFRPAEPEAVVEAESATDLATGQQYLAWNPRFGDGQGLSEFLYDGKRGTSLQPPLGSRKKMSATISSTSPPQLQPEGGYWRFDAALLRPAHGQSLAQAIRSARKVLIVPEQFDGRPAYRVTLQIEVDTPIEFLGKTVMAKFPQSSRLWLAADRNLLPLRIDALHTRNEEDLEGVPSSVQRASDFREIQPGVWWPHRIHLFLVSTNAAPLMSEARLESCALNNWARIPERLEFPPGTAVSDEVRQVNYHAGDPETEIEKSIAELEAIRQALDGLVGKPAPALPRSPWLNSQPLTWDDLQGQVVVVEFWAVDCGPCRHDLPRLQALHRKRSETGVAVVAVHPAGTTAEAVRKVLTANRLTFPVCIDTPAEGKDESFGSLCDQFSVYALPQSFVIGRDGRVAAHGELEECLKRATSLAAQPR